MKRFTIAGRRRLDICRVMQAVALGVLLAAPGGEGVEAKSYTFPLLGFHNTACSGWEWVRQPNSQQVTFTGTIDGDVSGEFWYQYQDRWSRQARKIGTFYELTLPNAQVGWYQLCWPHTTASNRQATGTLTTTVQESVATDTDGDGVPDEEDACPASALQDLVTIDGCTSLVENIFSADLFADGCTLADLVHEALALGGRGALERLLTDLADQGFLRHDEVEAILDCAGAAGEIGGEDAPPIRDDVREIGNGEDGGTGSEGATSDDIAPTPALPRQWYPFDEWPGDEDYSAYEPQDDLNLIAEEDADCQTRVHAFNVYTAGELRGILSFNQDKRGGPSYAKSMNGGNTKLWGFHDSGIFDSWMGYKLQVEIRFLGPLEHAFYGQMIADPQ